MCGGTRRSGVSSDPCQGLSPRVRGNLAEAQLNSGPKGSIPACAGEPRQGFELGVTCKVYPRVCGGTPVGRGPAARQKGLSPRVRGNRLRRIGGGRPGRSIPACAGEPAAPGRAVRTGGVYPRVCGGTGHTPAIVAHVCGLSPRVRGNHLSQPITNADVRSIPACAGEPTAACQWRRLGKVYPRVCGGTEYLLRKTRAPSGLSPRVRGNRPAAIDGPEGGVYPRVCGGTTGQCSRRFAGRGLSPRVRGNLLAAPESQLRKRSIPACAGEP